MISLDTVAKALQFAHQQNIKDILLVGGEPTLHPQITDIAQLVSDSGFQVILTTNYSRPDIIRILDGIVDCFNISYYQQRDIPDQRTMQSDITLSTLIHKRQLGTREALDRFIDKYQEKLRLKFSTLTPCNDWTRNNQDVPYLDSLPGDRFVLFDTIQGQEYRDCIIKRYDRRVNPNATHAWKCHVDGEISQSWQRTENFDPNVLSTQIISHDL